MLLAQKPYMDGSDDAPIRADDHDRRVQARGASAVASLGAPLAGYFRRRLGPGFEAEVEDLVQEVFLRAADQLGGGDEERARAYAFRVAASVWIDRHRRRQARRADRHVPFDPDRHDSPGFDLGQQLDARETLRAASLALASMPERTRTIFILRRIEGMGVREVAHKLGLSSSAVEKHMVRALEHLLAHTRFDR